jgi:hypothetical protein
MRFLQINVVKYQNVTWALTLNVDEDYLRFRMYHYSFQKVRKKEDKYNKSKNLGFKKLVRLRNH